MRWAARVLTSVPALALMAFGAGDEAAARAATAPDPIVAVLDTGVELGHPRLRAAAWRNPGEIAGNGMDDDRNGFVDDVSGADLVDADGDPADPRGHGTHIACLAARHGRGLRRRTGARIMALRVLGADGTGTSHALAEAVDYAARHGARVINLSVAYYGHDPRLAAALERAAAAGVLVVAAAGNGGEDLDRVPVYPASYRVRNMLVVAAAEGSHIAPWSAHGARSVDLAASGYEQRSCHTRGRYRWRGGTSQATALVSRAAALLLAARPEMDAAAVRDALLRSARRSASLRGATAAGGRVDARRALELAAAPVAGR